MYHELFIEHIGLFGALVTLPRRSNYWSGESLMPGPPPVTVFFPERCEDLLVVMMRMRTSTICHWNVTSLRQCGLPFARMRLRCTPSHPSPHMHKHLGHVQWMVWARGISIAFTARAENRNNQSFICDRTGIKLLLQEEQINFSPLVCREPSHTNFVSSILSFSECIL